MKQSVLFPPGLDDLPERTPEVLAKPSYSFDQLGTLVCSLSGGKNCRHCNKARRAWKVWCGRQLSYLGVSVMPPVPHRVLFRRARFDEELARNLHALMERDGWPAEVMADIAATNAKIIAELEWTRQYPVALCKSGARYYIVTYKPVYRYGKLVWARLDQTGELLGFPINWPMAERVSGLMGIRMGGIGGSKADPRWLVVLGLKPMPDEMTQSHERPTDTVPEDYYAP